MKERDVNHGYQLTRGGLQTENKLPQSRAFTKRVGNVEDDDEKD